MSATFGLRGYLFVGHKAEWIEVRRFATDRGALITFNRWAFANSRINAKLYRLPGTDTGEAKQLAGWADGEPWSLTPAERREVLA